MAYLIAYQNGGWTGATTWKTAATGTNATQAAGYDITTGSMYWQSTTTNYVYSIAFTVTNGEVIEGVAMFCQAAVTSPSGTVSVALSDDNGATATREVIVNATDLPPFTVDGQSNRRGSWVFFKFASPLTATGVGTYKVGIKSSVNAVAQFNRSSTALDFSRILRTNTAVNIAATDRTYIMAEWTAAATKTNITVTMDSTSSATSYGQVNIGYYGTLTYGTNESTNYHLKLAGNVNVHHNGTLNIGTVASPIPRSSNARLEFASTSGYEFGLRIYENGTFVSQGQSRTAGKNVHYCLLDLNASANSTTLTVDRDTGWLDGDEIVIAPTGSSISEYEKGKLNGNAGASSFGIKSFAGAGGGLQYAHLGTTAPFKAEIILLTRNVQIFGQSTSNTSYYYSAAHSIIDIDWTQFYFMGGTNGYSPTMGMMFVSNPTQAVTPSMNYSSAHNFMLSSYGTGGIYYLDRMEFTNNGVYSLITGLYSELYGASEPVNRAVITNNVFIGCVRYGIDLRYGPAFTADTFNNNRVAGLATNGNEGIILNRLLSISGIIVHNCSAGLRFQYSIGGTLSNSIFWHNPSWLTVNAGLAVYYDGNSLGGSDFTVENCKFYGNGGRDVHAQMIASAIFNNCEFGGTTTVNSELAFFGSNVGILKLNNCEMKATSGLFVKHYTSNVGIYPQTTWTSGSFTQAVANNTLFTYDPPINHTQLTTAGYFASQAHNRVAGNHKIWKRYGINSRDTTIFKTASPSERLKPNAATPNNGNDRLQSGRRTFGVENGKSAIIKVWVRESVVGDGADYNGNRVRLVLRRNDSAGITADTVLATATIASEGAWEELSAVTPVVTDDAILEVYVDCSGTTGWVNVDDWSVT